MDEGTPQPLGTKTNIGGYTRQFPITKATNSYKFVLVQIFYGLCGKHFVGGGLFLF